MRIGMAIETRVNIPLKHVVSADLRPRGKSHGDIALSLKGDRLLGYALLWPHARPWKFAEPQPMLCALPDAASVAEKLADACAAFNAIARASLEDATQAKEAISEVAKPVATPSFDNSGLKGAPA
jgi:hypothetical protein